MSRCDTCGKTVSLPFHCQYCGGNFCDDHRLPPNHACAGLAEWKKTPAPGVGIKYGSGGASAYGGGYATAPENKTARSSRKPLPYLKIAAVIVAAIILLVIAFVLAGGCVQPAGNDAAGSTNATPAQAAAAPQETTVPAATTIVTTTATPTPTPTATTTRTRPNTGPAVSVTQTVTAGGTATAAATLSISGVSATPIPSPSVTPVPGKIADDPYTVSTTDLAARVHELINSERQSYGLAPLSYDPALAAIALSHSNDMALNNYFAHVNPAGQTPADRGNAAGYTCKKDYGSYYTIGIAENLFQNNLYTSVTETNGVYTYDWTTPEEIARSSVTGWMNSEGHRKNILTATYDREGIGVAIASDDKVYITENFC
jgi:Uncharacterized protein with SCP/PR1 domains